MRVRVQFVPGLILAVILSACAMPTAPPLAEHPAPAIAAFRYIADPISARVGSPETTVERPDGSLIAFTDEANRAAFRANGAHYRLANEERIGFRMYDPVLRFPNGVHDPALGDLVLGSPSYSHDYGNATFLFASDANRQAFAQNPKKYIAGVGGYCLNAMRNNNTAMVVGDPHYSRFVEGLWYTFGGSVGPPRWDQVPANEKPIEVRKAWAFYFGQTGDRAKEFASLP
jgi:YHS domain-containing protein